MSWSCKRCGGEHPDSITVCHGGKGTAGGDSIRSYNPNANHCQHCGGEIPPTYDYCPCQSHWENFANR